MQTGGGQIPKGRQLTEMKDRIFQTMNTLVTDGLEGGKCLHIEGRSGLYLTLNSLQGGIIPPPILFKQYLV